MSNPQFRNLKDLFQNKYGLNIPPQIEEKKLLIPSKFLPSSNGMIANMSDQKSTSARLSQLKDPSQIVHSPFLNKKSSLEPSTERNRQNSYHQQVAPIQSPRNQIFSSFLQQSSLRNQFDSRTLDKRPNSSTKYKQLQQKDSPPFIASNNFTTDLQQSSSQSIQSRVQNIQVPNNSSSHFQPAERDRSPISVQSTKSYFPITADQLLKSALLVDQNGEKQLALSVSSQALQKQQPKKLPDPRSFKQIKPPSNGLIEQLVQNQKSQEVNFKIKKSSLHQAPSANELSNKLQQNEMKRNSQQLVQQKPVVEEIEQIRKEKQVMHAFNESFEEREENESDDQDEVLQVDRYNGVTKNSFFFHYVIGKGGFGKVWKVEMKKNRVFYAMKEMSKAKILTKRSVNSVMNEKQLLSSLRHSFLVNMSYAFQDRDNIYLILDILNGGDLRYHIEFFTACIVVALEYLHQNNVIHRDLKPENLVLDKRGYVRLTDLGVARVVKPENSQDTSGTPGYMAPEVMCRQNHGIGVDYFALGVIVYEFMLGRRPYQGRSRKEIRDQILAKQVQIKKSEIPEDWSVEAADFANRLLQRKPASRLGYFGPEEVKNHPWIRNFPWQKLIDKEIESPYIPLSIDDNGEYLNQISEDNDSQDELIQQNVIMLRKNSVQKQTKSTASTYNTNNEHRFS